MMTIYRTPSTDSGTFSVAFIDGAPFCVFVERPWINNANYISCIPPGKYQCIAFNSDKHGNVWKLQNVLGRTDIEIHAANIFTELKGCLAPGRRFGTLKGTPAVLESNQAMADLHSKLGNNFELTICG